MATNELIMSQEYRQQVIEEIEAEENTRRRAESFKRFEVYKSKQRAYVLDMLRNEFSEKTVQNMRTCTSINLSKAMVDNLASIYKKKPVRTFENATDAEGEALEYHYDVMSADITMKKANKAFKLQDQCAIQILPKMGELQARVLHPHHYDVIPSMENPEKPFAYILSGFDKQSVRSELDSLGDIQGQSRVSKNREDSNGSNESIADTDDYLSKRKKYVWWTDMLNFTTDDKGRIVEVDEAQLINPIGRLPFIDLAMEKDFEFWVNTSSGIVEFNLDFLVVLSDTCNTNRLQAYAQPVVISEEIPENFTVGPNNILHLALDPNRPESKPEFFFATPNPDLNASLDLQDRMIKYFLSSKGIDQKAITGKGDGNRYSSGVERLLAMIERFEASQDDMSLFQWAEREMFEIVRLWHNTLIDTVAFTEETPNAQISDEIELSIKYASPEMVQTGQEKEESIERRLEMGLISRLEAIMQDRGIEDRDEAARILAEIDATDIQFQQVTQIDSVADQNNEV